MRSLLSFSLARAQGSDVKERYFANEKRGTPKPKRERARKKGPEAHCRGSTTPTRRTAHRRSRSNLPSLPRRNTEEGSRKRGWKKGGAKVMREGGREKRR